MKSRISNDAVVAMYKAAAATRVSLAYCKREELITIINHLSERDGYIDLGDIIPQDLPDEVAWNYLNRIILDYLDKWCSNGHFSRWTDRGDYLYHKWLGISDSSLFKWS